MVKTLLALLAVEFMLPVEAQWAPHADPGRCENAAGYITVGSSTVCIAQPEGLVGSAGLLSADGVVSADGVAAPELLAGLPPLSEALRFCDTLLDDGDQYSTRMSCRQRTKEDDYPAVQAALEANPESMHVKRCISGAIRQASKFSNTRGFNSSDAKFCIRRGVQ